MLPAAVGGREGDSCCRVGAERLSCLCKWLWGGCEVWRCCGGYVKPCREVRVVCSWCCERLCVLSSLER